MIATSPVLEEDDELSEELDSEDESSEEDDELSKELDSEDESHSELVLSEELDSGGVGSGGAPVSDEGSEVDESHSELELSVASADAVSDRTFIVTQKTRQKTA